MGVHQTPTSRLKKRKRHVSVFDFDFDLDLPKHKPALEMQWHVMFSFPSYKPQRPEVFKGLVSMCSELIAALEDASGKAGRFVTEVYECLRKEQHLRYARMVIDTICTKQEMVVRKICEAKNMFIHVKKDVVTYVDSIDNMVLNRYRAMCQYYEKLGQLAEGLVSKCSELIAALEDASGKAGRFVKEVHECLRKEHHRYARMATDTITTKQAMVVRKICDAKNMFIYVKKDVVTYVDYVDNMVLNRYRVMCQCYEKLDQLAEIADVCKLIKYFTKYKDKKLINDEQIKNCCDLIPEDISSLILTISSGNKFCVDVEENFGQSEMEHVLEEHRKSFGEVRVLQVAFEEADAKLRVWILNSEPFFLSHVDSLLHSLRCAVFGLTITHKQLELLYEKNVLVTGYYKRFYGDWKVACATQVWKADSTRDPVADSTLDPVDTDSSPEPVGHSLLGSVGFIYDGSLFDD